MQHNVEDMSFINDSGTKVNYKRLVVTGYLDGAIERIELPISKDQATIYSIMKRSAAHTTEARTATEDEQQTFKDKVQSKPGSLFDDEDDV